MALSAADRIVAVSPGYADEIQTPLFGCGLEKFLIARKESISGILNGLDIDTWNPAADRWIASPFDSASLERRPQNKQALLATFDLPAQPGVPLLTFIGRMDQQKGVDLAIDGLRRSRHHPWQIIILGTGDPKLERATQKLAADFPDRVRAITRFDSQLSHQLYAGADMLLMPSRYEPCGLAQMIGMRYGCIPVARNTGGLRDTITPYAKTAASTGFLFDEASPEAFSTCLESALMVYNNQPEWQTLQLQGMDQDFSWSRSALGYAKLYQSLKEGTR
jgi:starch synthase